VADQNKSEAIRRVLEAVPDVRPAHAQAILAREGIDITPDLFRVVKMNWLRDRREEEESERKYKEYWSPEAVRDRVEERARQVERRRQAEEEERQQVLSSPGPPAPSRRGPPLPPGLVYDGLTNKIVPAPPTDEIRRLTKERKHELVARVVRSFSDDEWSEIVAEDRDAERSIAEDLAQDYSYGLTEEAAVARVVAGLRRRPASAGDDAFYDREDDLDGEM